MGIVSFLWGKKTAKNEHWYLGPKAHEVVTYPAGAVTYPENDLSCVIHNDV